MIMSTLQNWVGAGKELVNWCMEKLPSPPTSLTEGRFWFNTTRKRPEFYDGTNVKDFNSDVIKYAGIVDTVGPIWIDNGGGSITMQSCNVTFYDNIDYTGDLIEYNVPTSTFTLPDDGDSLIVADYNNGVPEFRLVIASSANYNHSTIIPIYRFWYAFGEVHSATLDSLGLGLAEKLAMRVGQVDYYHRVGNAGLVPSTPGVNLLSITAARVWAGPVLMSVAEFISSTNLCSYLYKNTSNVWIKTLTTTIPNTLYNPVGSNAVPLTNSAKWSVVYFYRSIGDKNESFIVLDTNEYNSRDNALLDSMPRSDIPSMVQSHCVLVGRAVFKYNTQIVTSDIQSAWITPFGTSGVTDHEQLTNLLGGEAGYHGHVTATQNTQINDAGNANGFLVLDSLGYVPMGNIPISLLGAMRYQTTWNASTNTPTLPTLPDTSTKGYYWKVNVAGTYDGHTYSVGDFIISNGTTWDWCDNVDAVTSVFGRTGPVTAQSGDYNLDQVDDGLVYRRITSAAKTNYDEAYTHSQTLGNPHGTTISAIPNLSDSLSDKVSKTDTNAQTVISQLKIENASLPLYGIRTSSYTSGPYTAVRAIHKTDAVSVANFGVAFSGGITDNTTTSDVDVGFLHFYRTGTGDLNVLTNRNSAASINIIQDGAQLRKFVVDETGAYVPRTDANYGGCLYFERTTGGYNSYIGKQPGNANANHTWLVESNGTPRIFIDAANNDGRVYLRTRDSSGNTVQVYLDSDGSLIANANPAISDDSTKFTTTSWVKDVAPQLSTGFSAGTTHVYRSYSDTKSANTVYFEY